LNKETLHFIFNQTFLLPLAAL